MMRKFIAAFLIALMVLSSSGCAGDLKTNGTITFTDANGTQVHLSREPQRVAVLFSSFADIWVTAGGKVDITVGETVQRGFADNDVILVDNGAGKSIDIERLIDAQPDLVIGSADIDAQNDAVALCRKAGIPACAFRVESFSDYMHVLKIFTDITGRADNYKTYGKDIQNKITSLIDSYQSISEPTRILFIRSGSSSKSMKAKTAQDHFACQMLKDLGTVNIAEEATILLDGLSIEEILLQDPEYIFISTMGDETAAKSYVQSVFEQPQWQNLGAVKNGNVIYLPKDLFQFKPNMRWAEAYQYLIDILN